MRWPWPTCFGSREVLCDGVVMVTTVRSRLMLVMKLLRWEFYIVSIFGSDCASTARNSLKY